MASDALHLAAKLRAEGRLDEAVTTLSEALRQDSRAHAVRYQLSLIEAQRGNFSEAENLARAAAASGGDAYARGLGHILAKMGKLEEAEVWLARALELNPRDAWAHANLGAVYGDQRKLDKAIACMQRALAIQPDFPWAKSSRDRMLAERNFLKLVRAAYQEFAARNGLDPDPDADPTAEIEFPSTTLDANGKPRFVMQVPASLVLRDLGAAHLFYREVAGRGYEFVLRRFLDLQLRSDDVFIDVGAHWGVHSLTAASRWPAQISVLAIEPHPENGTRLRQWVERNRVEADVEIIEKAIGEREGVAHLRVNASSMGHSLSTDGVAIDMTTLDQLLADREWLRWRRIFLKIDVEGYELEVLSGAHRLFSTCDVAAVIWEMGEFHERSIQEERNKATLDFLNSHRFKHFRFEDENLGGPLLPLQGNQVACNVYSLAPNLDRQERYA